MAKKKKINKKNKTKKIKRFGKLAANEKRLKRLKKVRKRPGKALVEKKRAKISVGKIRIKRKKKPVKLKLAKGTKPLIYETQIKIIGIGGGGSSIVSEIAPEIKKASFAVVNTDLQALKKLGPGVKRLQFGKKLTRGLGSGMNPQLGAEAAQNEKEKIRKLLEGQNLCILISCLGGGTGSGASPIFAEVSSQLGNLTLGIFTLPFEFEGRKKRDIAFASLEKIKPNVNAAIVIPNESIFQIIDKQTPLRKAFSTINKSVADGLGGLIEIIYSTSLINIDFSDLKTVLSGRGKLAYLSSVGIKDSSNSMEANIKKLLSDPLYPYSPKGAQNALFNISGGLNLSMNEINQIGKTISEAISTRGRIAFGVSQAEKDKGKIILFANGCKWEKWNAKEERTKRQPKKEKAKERELTPEVKKEPKKPEIKLRKKQRPKIKIKIKIKPKALNETEEKKTVLPAEEISQPATEEESSDEKRWEIPVFLRRK